MGGLSFDEDFNEAWRDIETFVAKLQEDIADESKLKKCLREIGKEISKAVKRYAPGRSQNPSYSDVPSRSEYKHVVDDITYTVRRSRLTKQWYVSIHGKKWTGYKWLWLNDGHMMKNGTWVSGNHFVDKAEAAASDAVNEIVDKYIKDALEGK